MYEADGKSQSAVLLISSLTYICYNLFSKIIVAT